jgi:site-specific DNA-methyltransferase (adenine-specific)
MPDNAYDLAIVDPPYGIGMDGQKESKKSNRLKHDFKRWDSQIPSEEYFIELKRISKNQIVWGGNYMTNYLEQKSGWIFWDKNNGDNNFSDGELAWTSFNCGLRKIEVTWNGMIQYDMKNKEDRFHPTQKPIKLYKAILDKYAKQGDKILDTHLGSGSIAIACHDYGFDLTACELDKEYYDKAIQRIKNHISQQKLF